MYPDVASYSAILNCIGSEGSPTLKYIYQVELPDSHVGLRQSNTTSMYHSSFTFEWFCYQGVDIFWNSILSRFEEV